MTLSSLLVSFGAWVAITLSHCRLHHRESAVNGRKVAAYQRLKRAAEDCPLRMGNSQKGFSSDEHLSAANSTELPPFSAFVSLGLRAIGTLNLD